MALHLGHRQSIDFDFFCDEPLDKDAIGKVFAFMPGAAIVQAQPDTIVISAAIPSGPVKISFFGGLRFGRIGDPLRTTDDMLLVASLDELMATKLKAALDRAEAKDYGDIARMLEAGVVLPRPLGGLRQMFRAEPAEVLRALGHFGGGDLPALFEPRRTNPRNARDRVRDLPDVSVNAGLLPGGIT